LDGKTVGLYLIDRVCNFRWTGKVLPEASATPRTSFLQFNVPLHLRTFPPPKSHSKLLKQTKLRETKDFDNFLQPPSVNELSPGLEESGRSEIKPITRTFPLEREIKSDFFRVRTLMGRLTGGWLEKGKNVEGR
jgi:hypothetical protein